MDENDAKKALLSRKLEGVDKEEPEQILSLGKVDLTSDKEASIENSRRLASEVGWKNIPTQTLPSYGLFYPSNSDVSIKAAEVGEIRHFSTMDEGDAFDINDKMNFIIEKCCRVKFGETYTNPKDLKEADRFYLIFAIKDLTFSKGENNMQIRCRCENPSCKHEENLILTKDAFSFYKPDEKLIKFYNESSKSFVITTKRAGEIELFVPSIGVMDKIKNWILYKRENKGTVDQSFVSFLPFILNDWRKLTNTTLDAMQLENMQWDLYRFSAFETWTKKVLFGTRTSITSTCTKCSTETITPIEFKDGFKSMFLISDDDE